MDDDFIIRPRLNKHVQVTILNNDRKQPDHWTSEIVHEIMTKVILSAPLPMDPIAREMALSNRIKFEQALWNATNPVVRRCITSEQMAKERG